MQVYIESNILSHVVKECSDYKLVLAAWYGIEKARHLHRLNNGTGEPDMSEAEQIGKIICRRARM